MKFNNQNSSENLYNSINFAPCGPPYDPSDRCVARSGFELESPGIDLFILNFHDEVSKLEPKVPDSQSLFEKVYCRWEVSKYLVCGYICQTTVIFGTLRDGILEINSLAINCFSY